MNRGIHFVVNTTHFYFTKKANYLSQYGHRPYNIHPGSREPYLSADKALVLATLAFILGLKDPYTEGHVRRVAVYAGRLAARLGLHPDEVNDIRLGGLLHDVGKIGLSDRIFRHKEVSLSKQMTAEVRRHPYIGRAILKQFKFPPHVLDYVLYHHERIDGSGYPCGLKADQIPLGAKIISVADCFDAIVTDRPYQKGKGLTEALATLEHLSGKFLCPDIVDIFSAEILAHGKIGALPKKHYALRLSLDTKDHQFGRKNTTCEH